MANSLAVHPHNTAFRADMPIRVNFNFDAAIAENSLGDDSDHINTIILAGHDKGRRFVIRIGGAGTNRRNEMIIRRHDAAIPGLVAVQKRNKAATLIDTALHHNKRIQPHQLPALIGVTITGTRLANGDVTHHRTGITADFFVNPLGAGFAISHGLSLVLVTPREFYRRSPEDL